MVMVSGEHSPSHPQSSLRDWGLDHCFIKGEDPSWRDLLKAWAARGNAAPARGDGSPGFARQWEA